MDDPNTLPPIRRTAEGIAFLERVAELTSRYCTGRTLAAELGLDTMSHVTQRLWSLGFRLTALDPRTGLRTLVDGTYGEPFTTLRALGSFEVIEESEAEDGA